MPHFLHLNVELGCPRERWLEEAGIWVRDSAWRIAAAQTHNESTECVNPHGDVTRFTEEETEVQRGEAICLWSQSWERQAGPAWPVNTRGSFVNTESTMRQSHLMTFAALGTPWVFSSKKINKIK